MKTVAATLGFLCMLLGCSGRERAESPQGTDSSKSSPASSALTAVDELSYEQKQGQELYVHYCAVCHGDQGAGDGFNSYNLSPKPRNLADSAYIAGLPPQELEQMIAGGGRSVNMSAEMPAYGGTLTKLEISYLAEYIRSLAGGKGTR